MVRRVLADPEANKALAASLSDALRYSTMDPRGMVEAREIKKQQRLVEQATVRAQIAGWLTEQFGPTQGAVILKFAEGSGILEGALLAGKDWYNVIGPAVQGFMARGKKETDAVGVGKW